MSEYLPVTPQTTDGLFISSFGYEDNPDLAHWGPGYRDFCILHYVVRGDGFFNNHKVSENQGFFFSNNQLHEYHSNPENPWNYFWIIFSAELAEKYVLPLIRMNDDNIFSFHFKGNLMQFCQNIFNEHTCLSNMQALSYFFKLMSLHESFTELQPGISSQHVIKAKLYIENNFNKNITVSDVAKEIFVNERYLYNLFIKYENISIKEYINRQRYTMACELLANTSLSVSEIAQSVGYTDVFAFSKFFQSRQVLHQAGIENRLLIELFFRRSGNLPHASDPCAYASHWPSGIKKFSGRATYLLTLPDFHTFKLILFLLPSQCPYG